MIIKYVMIPIKIFELFNRNHKKYFIKSKYYLYMNSFLYLRYLQSIAVPSASSMATKFFRNFKDYIHEPSTLKGKYLT